MASNIRNERFIRFENGISKHIAEIDCDTPEDLPVPSENWLMGSIAHPHVCGEKVRLVAGL